MLSTRARGAIAAAAAAVPLLLVLAAAAGLSRARAHHPDAVAVADAAGATLRIDARRRLAGAVLALAVTIRNRGPGALVVRLRDVALVGAAGQRYPALLPSEVKAAGARVPASGLLPARATLEAGRSVSGLVCFTAAAVRDAGASLRARLTATGDGAAITEVVIPVPPVR
jgi:hypothetical protein